MQQASQASNEVRLPRAVIAQRERVNARLLEIAKAAGTTSESVDNGETPAAPTADSPAATPTAATAPTPPATPTPPVDPRDSDPMHWKHRFSVVNGILQKERGQHAAEIEQLETRIVELEAQATSQAEEITALKQNVQQPSSSKVDLGQFLTPEVIERIGEDEATTMVDVAMRAAQAAVEKQLSKLPPAPAAAPAAPKADIGSREERDARRDFESRKAAFIDKIAAEIPDFEEFDNQEGWHNWLAKPVKEGSRRLRQAALTDLVRQMDADGVIDMMNEYKATLKVPTPPIAAHAEGGQGDGTPPPTDPTLRAPTQMEIRQFYKRAALNKVTAEERTRFEARMKLAR